MIAFLDLTINFLKSFQVGGVSVFSLLGAIIMIVAALMVLNFFITTWSRRS
jgi:ABC-type antimicrobial peptide transport system permease subunit